MTYEQIAPSCEPLNYIFNNVQGDYLVECTLSVYLTTVKLIILPNARKSAHCPACTFIYLFLIFHDSKYKKKKSDHKNLFRMFREIPYNFISNDVVNKLLFVLLLFPLLNYQPGMFFKSFALGSNVLNIFSILSIKGVKRSNEWLDIY